MSRRRLFVCAGPKRSGSTWLFNCVRLLCETHFGDCYARPIETYWGLDPAENHVVKCHEFRASLQDAPILVSERDWRDAAASAVRFGMVANIAEEVLEWTRKQMAHHAEWKSRAKLIVPFENIVNHPAEAVEHVAAAIGILADGGSVAEQLAALPAKVTGDVWDRNSLLHGRHITDGGIGTWQTTLSLAMGSAIEALMAS